jgi:outer membrane protein assembly factor BamB
MGSKLLASVLGLLLLISVHVAPSTALVRTFSPNQGEDILAWGVAGPLTEIGTVIYATADVYAFGGGEAGYSRSQLKFDTSSIPPEADITSAKLWLCRLAADNWDGDITLGRIENQEWGETITASEFDAQTLTDEENHAGKFMSHGWDYLNVLTQVEVDENAGHTFTSFRLRWANDDESEPSLGVDDGRLLFINSEADELSISFCASEYNGGSPYLEVTYIPPYLASPWPKFRRDLRNTGLSPHVGPADNTLKWSYSTSTSFDSSPSIGLDGTIYIGGFDGNVYAVNPDGALKWAYPTGYMIHSSPAIGNDGTIYIGSKGGTSTFYALNPDNTLKWSHSISQVYAPPAVAPDGTIYVGSRNDNFYAFDPDGTVKWSFATGGYIYSCPAISPDGTIYFGSFDGKLYALYDNGTLKWSYGIGSYIYASPAIAGDGTIYVGSAPGADGGDLYAINPDGTFKWKFATGNRVYSSAAIGPDNTIYVGSDNGYLYALYDNGSLKWKYTIGYPVQSSPAVDNNGDIYFGSSDGYLYALYDNGSLKWKYTTGAAVNSSPAIDNDGTVYFGTLDGDLYAIEGAHENC